MKHAGAQILDQLEPVLTEIRKLPGVRERTRGAFYRGGVGFLHFHEDPAGLFADLRTGADWERMPVNSKNEQAKLLQRVRRHLATP